MAKFDLKKAILENKATFFSSLTEGQFSWMTQDTGQQIGSQDENQIPVYMFDDKGKYYYENDYILIMVLLVMDLMLVPFSLLFIICLKIFRY